MQEDHIFITDDPEFRIEVKGDEDMNILRNPKMIPIQEFYKTEFYNEGKKKKKLQSKTTHTKIKLKSK